jgi:hypothetical protein
MAAFKMADFKKSAYYFEQTSETESTPILKGYVMQHV